MKNQDNAIQVSASSMNYVELSSQYNKIMDNCVGRDLTTHEEIKLRKVVDTYGVLFGVCRQTACEQMRTTP